MGLPFKQKIERLRHCRQSKQQTLISASYNEGLTTISKCEVTYHSERNHRRSVQRNTCLFTVRGSQPPPKHYSYTCSSGPLLRLTPCGVIKQAAAAARSLANYCLYCCVPPLVEGIVCSHCCQGVAQHQLLREDTACHARSSPAAHALRHARPPSGVRHLHPLWTLSGPCPRCAAAP
jgi:hypothetical protein